MKLSEMLARSARTKRQRALAVPKAKRLSTPTVMFTSRKVKTKRSKRRNKVKMWQKAAESQKQRPAQALQGDE